MSEPTRCPTCNGPCEEERRPITLAPERSESAVYAVNAWRKTYRTTAPDPATVTAMRELLWRVLTDVDDDFDGFSGVRDDILRFFGRDPDTEPWPSVRRTDGAE
jgi:hypothetical protein